MPLIPMRLPSVPKTKPAWEPGHIIFRWNNGTIDLVEGQSYARFLVHSSLVSDGEPHVVVSHKPSKIAVLRVSTVEDAIAGAEYLWDRCSEAFTRPNENIREALISPEIKAWIIRCNKERRFIR